MAYILTDGTDVASFYPLPNFKDGGKKKEAVERARGGKQFRYKFHDTLTWELPVTLVDSSFRYTLNNWFENNTVIQFLPDYTTDIYTVYVTNSKKPISKFVVPYDTLFKGVIKLEESG